MLYSSRKIMCNMFYMVFAPPTCSIFRPDMFFLVLPTYNMQLTCVPPAINHVFRPFQAAKHAETTIRGNLEHAFSYILVKKHATPIIFQYFTGILTIQTESSYISLSSYTLYTRLIPAPALLPHF